jgi:hypothetical protein
MTKLLQILVAALLAAGCNSNTSTKAVAASPDLGAVHANAKPIGTTEAKIVRLDGCYEMIFRQDTAHLELSLQDTTVTGRLVYNWLQKDDNTGTIKGVLRNNVIMVDYYFESEGVMSVRELVLRVKDDELVQGFGDLEESQGKIIFTDHENLQYDTVHPFIKIPCSR